MGGALTSIIIVSVVFGLFVLFAALRIRKNWKILRAGKSNAEYRLRKLDLAFSSIFLIASISFYLVFVLNAGR